MKSLFLFKNHKSLVIICVTSLTIALCILFSEIYTYANDQSQYEKQYMSLLINEGDTLWSIADTYNYSMMLSKEEYIDEVCRLNNISKNYIHSGKYIIIPYYIESIKEKR